MNRAEARQLLEQGTQRERLTAARVLSRIASEEDLPRLKRALRTERVPWIRSALEAGVARATVTTEAASSQVDIAPLSTEEALASEVYARATEELTDRFVHELRPLVGMARVHASREIPDFETSKTASALGQIQALLRGFDTLGRAAASPRVTECDVAALIRESVSTCQAELATGGIAVSPPALDGPEPLLTVTDPDLLSFAFRNGLKNAFEASKGTIEPVVVTWGQSQAEYWISVLDYGDGLPADRSGLFTLGATTKNHHLGMGLTIAQRAMVTLGGTISLDSQPNGSTRFELKCPRLGP